MEWLTEALNRVKHGTTRGNGLLIHLCSAAFNPENEARYCCTRRDLGLRKETAEKRADAGDD
jgi:hypothetical protein